MATPFSIVFVNGVFSRSSTAKSPDSVTTSRCVSAITADVLDNSGTSSTCFCDCRDGGAVILIEGTSGIADCASVCLSGGAAATVFWFCGGDRGAAPCGNEGTGGALD